MKAIILGIALMFTLSGAEGCNPRVQKATVNLPHTPSYYRACFSKLTPIPIGTLTRQKVVRLVAVLRRSEKAKSQCGKDLLAWYDTVRLTYAKK